jgi:hypothetical protein
MQDNPQFLDAIEVPAFTLGQEELFDKMAA